MSDLKKKIGGFVRQCRLRTGKSQTGFAEAIGSAKQTVSELERGVSLPSFERLEQIIIAADLDLEDCLSVPVGEPKDKEERKLLRLFRTLSASRRSHVVALVEDLAKSQPHQNK